MINYTYTHKCVSPNTWEGTVRKSVMMGWDPDARKQELGWMAWAGQPLDLPSGPSVAERQVLLGKALHPPGQRTGGGGPCAVKGQCRHVLGDSLEQVSSKRDVSLNS